MGAFYRHFSRRRRGGNPGWWPRSKKRLPAIACAAVLLGSVLIPLVAYSARRACLAGVFGGWPSFNAWFGSLACVVAAIACWRPWIWRRYRTAAAFALSGVLLGVSLGALDDGSVVWLVDGIAHGELSAYVCRVGPGAAMGLGLIFLIMGSPRVLLARPLGLVPQRPESELESTDDRAAGGREERNGSRA